MWSFGPNGIFNVSPTTPSDTECCVIVMIMIPREFFLAFFEGYCALEISGKKRLFQGITLKFVIFVKRKTQDGPGTELDPETATARTVFPGSEPGLEPHEPLFRNQNRNRTSLCNCTERQKNSCTEEPSEPKTGTARTVPQTNCNLEVPKRHPPTGHPQNLLEFYLNFLGP